MFTIMFSLWFVCSSYCTEILLKKTANSILSLFFRSVHRSPKRQIPNAQSQNQQNIQITSARAILPNSQTSPTTIPLNINQKVQSLSSKGGLIQTQVTTMASGHTASSNTITSVLAGRSPTAVTTVTVSASSSPPTNTPQVHLLSFLYFYCLF